MDGEAKAALEPILHLSVPLGPVVWSPELLEPVLKLEPSVFLKPMLVFVELVVLLSVDGGQLSSPTEGLYPPGGFSNMLESNPFANHPNATENLHFVGAGMSRSPVSPQYMSATGTPSPAQQTDHMVDDLDAEENETNNIPDDSRTDKHLNWSVPEDIRLASGWLHNSKDPVDGNERKADAYWTDVTEEYNKTTETSRKRNRNQLKIRWDRSKKPLSDFHGCWANASRVWQSGMSDDQLIDKALEMWSSRNNNKAFHLLHMWKVVRGEQKWSAYLARLKKAEVQKSLADKKIEAARINHEAAHEQTKCKMLETYTQLLLVPTGQLSADALAERNLALESLRLTLFPK